MLWYEFQRFKSWFSSICHSLPSYNQEVHIRGLPELFSQIKNHHVDETSNFGKANLAASSRQLIHKNTLRWAREYSSYLQKKNRSYLFEQFSGSNDYVDRFEKYNNNKAKTPPGSSSSKMASFPRIRENVVVRLTSGFLVVASCPAHRHKYGHASQLGGT